MPWTLRLASRTLPLKVWGHEGLHVPCNGNTGGQSGRFNADEIYQSGISYIALIFDDEVAVGFTGALQFRTDATHVRMEVFRFDPRQVIYDGLIKRFPSPFIYAVFDFIYVLAVRAELDTVAQIQRGMDAEAFRIFRGHGINQMIQFRSRGGRKIISLAVFQTVSMPVDVNAGHSGDTVGIETGAVDYDPCVKSVFSPVCFQFIDAIFGMNGCHFRTESDHGAVHFRIYVERTHQAMAIDDPGGRGIDGSLCADLRFEGQGLLLPQQGEIGYAISLGMLLYVFESVHILRR